MDLKTEKNVIAMAKGKISAYDKELEEAKAVDEKRGNIEEMEEIDGRIMPFETLVPNKHFYDPLPDKNAYDAIDVCRSREILVKSTRPLEIVNESRVGEFTPTQWQQHQQTLITESNKLMMESERLRFNCSQRWRQIHQETEAMQKETTNRLDDRVARTLDAKELLKIQIDKTTKELHTLREMRARLQIALFEMELPEKNNEECQHTRRFRRGIDNTRDGVSQALNIEQKTLLTGRNLLTKALQEIECGLFRLLEIKKLLEHSWSDKQEAMQIDHGAAKLQLNPILAQFKPISAALNEGASTVVTWESRINEHKAINEREIIHATQLRGAANEALTEVSEDILSAGSSVDSELNGSIGRIEFTISSLKEEDEKVRRELANQEINTYNLREELKNKESPLQVAEMRHSVRSYRPGMDRCLDHPHYSLISELKELSLNIASLRELLGSSEARLEHLHRQHEKLVTNILEREHALSLESRCVAVRKCRPTAARLQGL